MNKLILLLQVWFCHNKKNLGTLAFTHTPSLISSLSFPLSLLCLLQSPFFIPHSLLALPTSTTDDRLITPSWYCCLELGLLGLQNYKEMMSILSKFLGNLWHSILASQTDHSRWWWAWGRQTQCIKILPTALDSEQTSIYILLRNISYPPTCSICMIPTKEDSFHGPSLFRNCRY